MPFKTTLEAAIAHLVSKGIIKGSADVVKDLGLKSRGTVSAYATGATKMSGNFRTMFENRYKLSLSDFEHLVGPDAVDGIKKPSPNDEGYKDRYISMLEKQVEDKDRQLSELKDRMDSRTLQITDQIEKLQVSLKEVVREQKATLSYAKTLYDSVIEHRAALEGDSPKVVKSKMDKLLSDHFAQSAETDSR